MIESILIWIKAFILFPSQLVLLLVVVGLEKESMDRAFENFYGIVSPSCFDLVSRTHARLLESFWNPIFPLLIVVEKKYIKLNVDKVVDHITRESCIPTDSMKSGDDYSNLVYNNWKYAYRGWIGEQTNLMLMMRN